GLVARFRRNGQIKQYGEPNADPTEKLWQSIDAVHGARPILCGTRATMAHAICVAAAHASVDSVHPFPRSLLRTEPWGETGTMVSVEGLGASLVHCYDQGILPAEDGGLSWSRASARTVRVKDVPEDEDPGWSKSQPVENHQRAAVQA